MQILEFAKYLLTLNPEANAARLALYHYVKNSYPSHTPLTPEIINRFLSRCWTLNHWREHRGPLTTETVSLVESFLESHHVKWEDGKINTDLQIIELENSVDLYEMVKNFLNSQRLESEKIRILPDKEEGMVGIRLQPDGGLLIHYFDRLATIRRGKIEPLCSDLAVKYAPNLEPAVNFNHHLMIQPGVTCHFQMKPDGPQGHVIKGYTFNKMEDFAGQPLNRLPILFYPLKRLERFFVNRATDPLYVELTQLLDQAVGLLRDGHPDSEKLASAALERGQNALKFIFVDDKLLTLLLRELSTLLFEKMGQDGSWQRNLKKLD